MRAGITRSAITRRVETRYLHRLYRGVYAVGHTSLSEKGRMIAAVFACGPRAVLSHESAAYVWSFSPRSDLERRFLRLLRSNELPLPEVNTRVGPYEVDLLWRAERIIAELDGYASLLTCAVRSGPPP